jgi:hypothetical protein
MADGVERTATLSQASLPLHWAAGLTRRREWAKRTLMTAQDRHAILICGISITG